MALDGTRDRLIHGYFGVDYELVWEVVHTKIPELRHLLQEIVPALLEVRSANAANEVLRGDGAAG